MGTLTETEMAERLRVTLDRLPDENKALFALAFLTVDWDASDIIEKVGQAFLNDSRDVLQERGGEVLQRLGFDADLAEAIQDLSRRAD